MEDELGQAYEVVQKILKKLQTEEFDVIHQVEENVLKAQKQI